jgi:hypothetical protein
VLNQALKTDAALPEAAAAQKLAAETAGGAVKR